MRQIIVLALLSATAFAGCLDDSDPDTFTADSRPPIEPGPDAIMTGPTGELGASLAILNEPTIGEAFQVTLKADRSATWTLETTEWAIQKTLSDPAATIELPPLSTAERLTMDWTVQAGRETVQGNITFDVWGTPIQFNDEPTAEQDIRPGIQSEVCTTNYIFHYKWQKMYLGSAAHCMDKNDEPDNPECKVTESTIGDNESVEGGHTLTHAYSSWTTMNRVEECFGANDFGLFEIPEDLWPRVHPKAHGIVGHVNGLGDCRTLPAAFGFGGDPDTPYTDIVGYGRSSLRHGVVVAGEPDTIHDDKEGVFLAADSQEFQCHVYLFTPGIPGDSGGPLATADGFALGAASTVTVYPTPGSNHYTNIAKALEFMQEHEGWAPELVTSG